MASEKSELTAYPRDTSPDAARVQIEAWRRMSPTARARVIGELSRAVQELSLAGIRLRHPGVSEHECLLRLARLKLGPRLASRAYPEAAGLDDS